MKKYNPSLKWGKARDGYWRNPFRQRRLPAQAGIRLGRRCGYLKWSIEIITSVCFNQKPFSTMDRFVFLKHIN